MRGIVIVLWDREVKEDSESSVDLEAAFLKGKALKKGSVSKELDIASSSAAELFYEQLILRLVCTWRNSYSALCSDSASF